MMRYVLPVLLLVALCVPARGEVASWYGYTGRRTANGEPFPSPEPTAAHKSLPFGTRVRVTDLATGRHVVVRINDRGPFIKGRHIDLNPAAANRLDMKKRGHIRVRMDIE